MNIYLDINGVLLTKNLEPALFVNYFLNKALKKNKVYWLTTHSKSQKENPINYLAQFFDKETLELMKLINMPKWNVLKTEAIDFTQEFLWFDDSLLQAEEAVLKGKGKYNSWVKVDLDNNPKQLKTEANKL